MVDKIPDPSGVWHGSIGGHNGEGEYQGLSLLMVQSHEVQWSALPPRLIGGSGPEEPSLVISVQSEGTELRARESIHTVGLRLAHTVFINGRDRTLLGMRFASGEGPPGQYSFTMDKAMELERCKLINTDTNTQDNTGIERH